MTAEIDEVVVTGAGVVLPGADQVEHLFRPPPTGATSVQPAHHLGDLAAAARRYAHPCSDGRSVRPLH
jgi:hypothetical protein